MRILLTTLLVSFTCGLLAEAKSSPSKALIEIKTNLKFGLADRNSYYLHFLDVLLRWFPPEAGTLRSTIRSLKAAYGSLHSHYKKIVDQVIDILLLKFEEVKVNRVTKRQLKLDEQHSFEFQTAELDPGTIFELAIGEYMELKQVPPVITVNNKTTGRDDKNMKKLVDFAKLITDIRLYRNIKHISKGENPLMHEYQLKEYKESLKTTKAIIKRLNGKVLPQLVEERRYAVGQNFTDMVIDPMAQLLVRRNNIERAIGYVTSFHFLANYAE